MAKLSLGKHLAKMTAVDFEKYMKNKHPKFAGDWKKYYKEIGGKL